MSSEALRDGTRMWQWSGRLHWSAATDRLLADGRTAYAMAGAIRRRSPTPTSVVAKPTLPRDSVGGAAAGLREGLRDLGDLGTLRLRSSIVPSVLGSLCQATNAACARSLRLSASAVALVRRVAGGTGCLHGDAGRNPPVQRISVLRRTIDTEG